MKRPGLLLLMIMTWTGAALAANGTAATSGTNAAGVSGGTSAGARPSTGVGNDLNLAQPPGAPPNEPITRRNTQLVPPPFGPIPSSQSGAVRAAPSPGVSTAPALPANPNFPNGNLQNAPAPRNAPALQNAYPPAGPSPMPTMGR